MKITTYSPKETQSFAKKLAKNIGKCKLKKRALILALEGDLGGGKTTFLQGFARGLGIKEKILSPTFVILRRFKITNIKYQISKIKNTPSSRAKLTTGQANQKSKIFKFGSFCHIDCYRIGNPKEILNLGWDEIINNPENIVAVEWADRIKRIIPRNATKIKFQFINKNTRRLILNNRVALTGFLIHDKLFRIRSLIKRQKEKGG